MNKRIIIDSNRHRQDIISAANKLFLKSGYENVTITQIAREAKFTRKTIYAYFKTKEELYLMVFLNTSRNRWRYIKQKMNQEKQGMAKLSAYARAVYEYSLKYPEQLRFGLYWEHNGLDFKRIRKEIADEFHRPQSLAINHTIEAFKTGIRDGSLREDLDIPKIMSYMCLTFRAMMNEIILGYQKKDFYFDFVDFFLAAIKKTG